MPGTFDDDEAFDLLAATVEELHRDRGTGGNVAFYLSIPRASSAPSASSWSAAASRTPATASGAAW